MKKHVFGLMFCTALLITSMWCLEITISTMNKEGTMCWMLDCYDLAWDKESGGMFFYHLCLYMIPVSAFGMSYFSWNIGERNG